MKALKHIEAKEKMEKAEAAVKLQEVMAESARSQYSELHNLLQVEESRQRELAKAKAAQNFSMNAHEAAAEAIQRRAAEMRTAERRVADAFESLATEQRASMHQTFDSVDQKIRSLERARGTLDAERIAREAVGRRGEIWEDYWRKHLEQPIDAPMRVHLDAGAAERIQRIASSPLSPAPSALEALELSASKLRRTLERSHSTTPGTTSPQPAAGASTKLTPTLINMERMSATRELMARWRADAQNGVSPQFHSPPGIDQVTKMTGALQREAKAARDELERVRNQIKEAAKVAETLPTKISSPSGMGEEQSTGKHYRDNMAQWKARAGAKITQSTPWLWN